MTKPNYQINIVPAEHTGVANSSIPQRLEYHRTRDVRLLIL